MAATPVKLTASGIITTHDCEITSITVGTDGVNDPAITVYSGQSAHSDNIIIPTVTLDASVLGWNGIVLNTPKNSTGGAYIAISSLGTGVVVVDIKLK